jgi:hypothetical protein
MAAQRPAAKEGGRREEENRSGISAGDTGRLCNAKTLWVGARRDAGSHHAIFDAKPVVEFPPGAIFARSCGRKM